MKTRTASLILLFFLSAVGLLAAETNWEFPAKKLGLSGGYNLGFLTYTDKAAVFYVAVCSGKIDIENVTATSGSGQALEIISKGKEKALMKNFPWVKAALTREQMEVAAKAGDKITITSGKKSVTVEFSAKEFADLLGDAERKDTFTAVQKSTEQLRAAIEENNATFDPSELAPYAKSGSSKITGQAFLKTRGGDVKVGAGNDVYLVPATQWTTILFELMREDYMAGTKTAEQRDLLRRAMRVTQADATGNFEFTDIPAGDYKLETKITWSTGSSLTGGRVSRKVAVAEGQTQKVMLTE